jgi:hypothetical protein
MSNFAYVIGNEEYLKRALAFIGPLAVTMKGDLNSFYYYSTGIYDDPACVPSTNHAVCLVGRKNGNFYEIFKKNFEFQFYFRVWNRQHH